MSVEHYCVYSPHTSRYTHYNYPDGVGDWEYVSPEYYVIDGVDEVYFSESALKRMGMKGSLIRQYEYITVPNPRYPEGPAMKLYAWNDIF
jgi:hypothetical protein